MASTTGQMSVVGGKFVLDHTLTQQTGTVIDFNTTDQFIDKEIRLQLAARPATAELTLTGNTTQSPTWEPPQVDIIILLIILVQI